MHVLLQNENLTEKKGNKSIQLTIETELLEINNIHLIFFLYFNIATQHTSLKL